MKPLLLAAGIFSCIPVVRAAAPLPIYDAATAGGSGNFNTAWPGFKACWDQRQKKFAATRESDHGAIVFFGDSLTELAPLGQLFPGRHVANRGISGDTSRGMLFRVTDNVLDLEPAQVVILCGANDMVQPGASAEATAANVAAICTAIHNRFPAIPVTVLKVLPNAKAGPAVVEDFNKALDHAMSGLKHVTRIDTHSPFLKPDGTADPALFKDGVHPNAKGYEIFRDAVSAALPKAPQP